MAEETALPEALGETIIPAVNKLQDIFSQARKASPSKSTINLYFYSMTEVSELTRRRLSTSNLIFHKLP